MKHLTFHWLGRRRYEGVHRLQQALVEARAARGVRIRYADMRAAFATREGYRTQLLADLVHPNDAGYVVMAEVWAKVVWP